MYLLLLNLVGDVEIYVILYAKLTYLFYNQRYYKIWPKSEPSY